MSRVRKFDQMRGLVDAVRELAKDPEVGRTVRERIREFEEIGRGDWRLWARELAFCVLAANFKAIEAFRMAGRLWETGALFEAPVSEVEEILRSMGHRFPRTRAEYIVSNRPLLRRIREVVPRLSSERAREWLRENVRGLGMKESSHFLRNTGRKDVAIIDRHILRVMREYGLIGGVPKSLTRGRYLQLEGILRGVAGEAGLSLAELDLYMWYMKTGFVFR